MWKLLFTFLAVSLVYEDISAQIHPDLTGDELHQEVVTDYKPMFVETYSHARELMYTEIYNVDDSVYTIYSDHRLYLPPSEELPIQYLAQGATANGINAEHIYPRSKGAREEYGNAFSDLHNLAPARWAVNEARANHPFGDIEDHITERWYKRSDTMAGNQGIPETMIDAFAEVEGYGTWPGVFEPRESAKGDIARSVFYFFTMYREEAMREDPAYFEEMRENLCAWHNADPVDELEMDRNIMKAMVQDGKTNPFINDCSLANRMYCPDFDAYSCQDFSTALDNAFVHGEELQPAIKIYPNPNNGIFTLDISNINPGDYRVDIYFLSGQLIYSLNEKLDYFNSIKMWNAKPGMHIIHLTSKETGRKYSGTFQIIK